ncbi:DNA methyltransferase [Telmatobacter sp. DSM 110680]|uniref:DNA methyltransferase n=1 Tax=Telmatobacter sp. DSM 110680 TaxID=3036704 RepID=A0AAU7DP44_9BACT
MANQLYYGDNLDVLRASISTESVDLVYLDPPFNSQANYNVLFKAHSGQKSEAQIEAFEDTWHWNDHAERAFDEVIHSGNSDVAEMLRAFRSFLKENDMMAYLTMMAVRLVELHRVLKPTGSLYLHCDPTASHYLKILLDAVFGPYFFRNEIIWKRTSAHSDARRRFGDQSDVILFYAKSEISTFHRSHSAYSDDYLESHYSLLEPDGRRYTTRDLRSPGPRPNLTYDYKGYKPHPNGWSVSLETMKKMDAEGRLYFPASKDGRIRVKRYLDEMPGTPIGNIWDDISPINSQAQERLGYPTQKPLSLLERIIESSSNEGDTVLDPFCGCGTTIHAAQKLKRQWIGIDVTHLAISLIEKRLKDAFPGVSFEIHGTPKDIGGAQALAAQDKYQFQWWAVSLVDAVPYGGKKKGADSGIDGFIYFKPDGKETEKAIVSVKGGENINVSMIRDLAHVVDREKARIGVFITLAEPTKPMRLEAVKTGFYEMPYQKFPKIQILTIEELFAGKRPDIPLIDPSAFKKAAKDTATIAKQDRLF